MVGVQAWAEVGERVREARLANGLSQGQLAEAAGLERTALVRVEAGQRQLNAMELFRIADVLRLPLAHFVSRPPEAMVSRRQALVETPDAAGRARFRLDSALEQQARDTEWLVAHELLTPPDPLPMPEAIATAADAKRLAQAARAALGQEKGPLGPMADVAERLGMYLTVVDVDADGASISLDTYGVAVTGAVAEPGRRRWTAAHEIGHHVLRDEYHADMGVSASRDEREQLVDVFAGELLLPCADLTEALRDVAAGDVRSRMIEIAARYRVSWSAVVTMSTAARLLDKETAQRLRAQVPVRGDFIAIVGNEPQPDLELGARGSQWKQAVVRAYSTELITAERAIELLGGGLEVGDLPDRNAS